MGGVSWDMIVGGGEDEKGQSFYSLQVEIALARLMRSKQSETSDMDGLNAVEPREWLPMPRDTQRQAHPSMNAKAFLVSPAWACPCNLRCIIKVHNDYTAAPASLNIFPSAHLPTRRHLSFLVDSRT